MGTAVAVGAVGLGLLGASPAVAATAPSTARLAVTDQLSAPPHTQGYGEQVALSADGNTAVVRQGNGQDGRYADHVAVLTRDATGWRRADELAPYRAVYGLAVSADGSTVALARQQERTDQVQAEVYVRGDQGWALTVSLPLPDSGRDPRQVALSADGSQLLVGAPTSAWTNGDAVSFHHGAQGWTQDQINFQLNEGRSVALSGDGRTAVLSSDYWGGPSDQVYVRNSYGYWDQAGTIPRPARSYSGREDALSISYDGTSIAVGNPDGYRPTASVYTRQGYQDYVRTADFGARWTADNALGSSVALSADGTSLLVGAPGRRQRDGLGAGAVFRFTLGAGGWTWGGLLNVGNPTPWDHLGTSVAVSADGSTVLAGAPGRVVSAGGPSGAVVVYTAPVGAGPELTTGPSS